ncbi:MAG: YtxH domain-containing protein [Patescibacteria group bacterium]
MLNLFQRKQKRAQAKKIFIFSVLSGFISAVAAIFLTPKSGKQMREMATDSAKDAKTKIGEVGKEVGTKVKDWSKEAAVKAESLKSKALKVSQDTLKAFNNDLDEADNGVKKTVDKVKSKTTLGSKSTRKTSKKNQEEVEDQRSDSLDL